MMPVVLLMNKKNPELHQGRAEGFERRNIMPTNSAQGVAPTLSASSQAFLVSVSDFLVKSLVNSLVLH